MLALLFDKYNPNKENISKHDSSRVVFLSLKILNNPKIATSAKNSPMVSALEENPLQESLSDHWFNKRGLELFVPTFC